MKKITLFVSLLILIGVSVSFKTKDSKTANKITLEVPSLVCNPPVLVFEDAPAPTILCSNKYYYVTVSGTNNVVFTSITGGTLYGPTAADLPNNPWRIKTGNGGTLTIQVYGQCAVGSSLVTSPTMTYTYTVLTYGGPGNACSK